MNFSEALENLKAGNKIARKGWNGKGMWARLVNPPYDTRITVYNLRPWLGLKDVNDNFGPWVPSTSDILAEDWEVVTQ